MEEQADKNGRIILFENSRLRRKWHNERWYFVIEDVVVILTNSVQPSGYIKDMRRRDPDLSEGWGQIATPLPFETKGGVQGLNCADIEGVFRIIQSIPSTKAEPFKRWLARVGKERIDEIQDPELAMNRAKEIYERKGYPLSWIDKRMRGINVRNTLTDEWKERGVRAGNEFAILTDEIYKGTFEKSAKELKEYKSLDRENNLRDHMGDMELILTMLGEATTTELTKSRDSKGLPKLKTDAKDGGAVAGRTRKDIEKQTKKKVLSKDNFLDLPQLPQRPLDVSPKSHHYDDK